jgi:thiamine-phosphate kinase
VLTTDMLHETTDFPVGVTRRTAGWRAVGASLSDLAAMGAEAVAAVAVYGAPGFDETDLDGFLRGARAVCESVEAEYVGGDLDETGEFTVATTALGHTTTPVRRTGAGVGDAVCVTGALGRTAAALELFAAGETDRGNGLFRFPPRVAAGRVLAPYTTSGMDVSDGLARSLHQLAEINDCGFEVDSERVPIHPAVAETTPADERLAAATTVGEDFELLVTLPPERVADAQTESSVAVTEIGTVTQTGVRMDGEPLADEGWRHGE